MSGCKLKSEFRQNELFISKLQGVDWFGRNFARKWFWILVYFYGSHKELELGVPWNANFCQGFLSMAMETKEA